MSERITKVLAEHVRLVEGLKDQIPLLQTMARRIIEAIAHDKRIYTLGNGGSAADAQHIAAELVGRFKTDRRPLPAVAMTTDTSTLLSVGNDYGFEQIFGRQIEALVRQGDIVWILSTSGRSPNVLAAAQSAQKCNAVIIGFTGRDGRALESLCEHCLRVDHDASERIQEIHQIAYHLVCELVERHFAHAGEAEPLTQE